MKRRYLAVAALLVFPLPAADFAWREALPGYQYQFPRDHFEHEDFRTEWWYYTGNVTGAKGERYGFELVFFREGAGRDSQNKSAWSIQDVYLAHAALSDVNGKKFSFDERVNRAGPGIAGASFAKQRIWNGNWSVQFDGERQTLDAVSEQFRFHLKAAPGKPFVIQGENGVSQKAEGKGRASHYVSFPLLELSGSINGSPVTGRAWMDHEWFTEQLAADQVGWDWFSIQLDDKTELMLFELRRKDGSIDPYSSGTFIDAKGIATHLKRGDFSLQPVAYWKKYPVEWRVQIPSRKIDVVCKAVMQDQELKAKQGPSYWEGAVDFKGSHTGVGYLEMTGYDGKVKF
jgi:predicted secreted hydrolase